MHKNLAMNNADQRGKDRKETDRKDCHKAPQPKWPAQHLAEMIDSLVCDHCH
jgi:hypothetical protein